MRVSQAMTFNIESLISSIPLWPDRLEERNPLNHTSQSLADLLALARVGTNKHNPFMWPHRQIPESQEPEYFGFPNRPVAQDNFVLGALDWPVRLDVPADRFLHLGNLHPLDRKHVHRKIGELVFQDPGEGSENWKFSCHDQKGMSKSGSLSGSLALGLASSGSSRGSASAGLPSSSRNSPSWTLGFRVSAMA